MTESTKLRLKLKWQESVSSGSCPQSSSATAESKHELSCVRWLPFGGGADTFAVAGGNRLSLYRLFGGGAQLLQCYVDEAWDEVFHALEWAALGGERVVACVCGELGVVKVVDFCKRSLARSLKAHGAAINSVRRSPKQLSCVLTAADDFSVRLWNLDSGECLAIFTGFNGHRSFVKCADWHVSGTRLISSGTDAVLKTWRTPATAETEEAVFEQFPIASTRKVHRDLLSHASFVGDLIVSQSTAALLLWRPQLDCESKAAAVVAHFPLEAAHTYCGFALSSDCRLLAVGGDNGVLLLWNIPRFLQAYASHSVDARCTKRICVEKGKRITAVDFSNDMKRVVVCIEGNTLAIVELLHEL